MALITNTKADDLLGSIGFPYSGSEYMLGTVRTYFRAGEAFLRGFDGRERRISDLEMIALNVSAYKGELPTHSVLARLRRDESLLHRRVSPIMEEPMTTYWVKPSARRIKKVAKDEFSFLAYLALDGYVTDEELRNAMYSKPISASLISVVKAHIMEKTQINIRTRQGRRGDSNPGYYIGEISDHRKEYQKRRQGVAFNAFTGYVQIGSRKRILSARQMDIFDAVISARHAGISRDSLHEQVYGTHGRPDAQMKNIDVQKTMINKLFGGNYLVQREHRFYFNAQ